jgi:hypothetical protein
MGYTNIYGLICKIIARTYRISVIYGMTSLDWEIFFDAIPVLALAVDRLLVPGSLSVSAEDPKHSEE